MKSHPNYSFISYIDIQFCYTEHRKVKKEDKNNSRLNPFFNYTPRTPYFTLI